MGHNIIWVIWVYILDYSALQGKEPAPVPLIVVQKCELQQIPLPSYVHDKLVLAKIFSFCTAVSFAFCHSGFLFVFNKEAGLLTYILLNWDILWCIRMQTTYLDEVVWQL